MISLLHDAVWRQQKLNKKILLNIYEYVKSMMPKKDVEWIRYLSCINWAWMDGLVSLMDLMYFRCFLEAWKMAYQTSQLFARTFGKIKLFWYDMDKIDMKGLFKLVILCGICYIEVKWPFNQNQSTGKEDFSLKKSNNLKQNKNCLSLVLVYWKLWFLVQFQTETSLTS